MSIKKKDSEHLLEVTLKMGLIIAM